MQSDFKNFYDCFLRAAREAGEIARNARRAGLKVTIKSDNTPVTEADIHAGEHITRLLTDSFPNIPVISEEDHAPEYLNAPDDMFFLIDPIDGTRCYIAGGDDYAVNIALIVKRRPAAGMIYIPEAQEAFFAAQGEGAFKITRKSGAPFTRLRTRPVEKDAGARFVTGKSKSGFFDAASLGLPPEKVTRSEIGSALKFCLIAQAEADFYPRKGATGEWDTAAGDILLAEAGGGVRRFNGSPLLYGKNDFINEPFIAYGDTDFFKHSSPVKT